MARSNRITFVLCVGVLAAGFGWGMLRQWEQNRMLRIERWALQREADDVQRLGAENRRLLASQVSTVELERLRADRAALPRLREELADLQKRSQARSP